VKDVESYEGAETDAAHIATLEPVLGAPDFRRLVEALESAAPAMQDKVALEVFRGGDPVAEIQRRLTAAQRTLDALRRQKNIPPQHVTALMALKASATAARDTVHAAVCKLEGECEEVQRARTQALDLPVAMRSKFLVRLDRAWPPMRVLGDLCLL
jgi:hypothetical protein